MGPRSLVSIVILYLLALIFLAVMGGPKIFTSFSWSELFGCVLCCDVFLHTSYNVSLVGWELCTSRTKEGQLPP